MASSSSQSRYEVFLSFRGEDTRNGFTSHLAAALHRKQIQFFIDDEELKKGDEISPALSNAMETSDISIIIFSKDYAASKWCLNELVKILDCKRINGQIVIPVFYQVDPSDVRKQKGSFERNFIEHEKNFLDKVQKWRDALTEASNFSGYDATESRNEAELVEEIVADISKKLEDTTGSTDFDGFVGLNSRIKEMESLLCLESHDVQIVGIWGMGGIGKTTIASVVFHQISRHFQGKCFMADVREKSNKTSVIHVRDEVISEVLGDKNLKIGTPTIPPNIRKRLQRMKVLIVLDDVHDEFTQLESLAGGVDRFSPGSRIIITTRDKQVLDKCGVEILYEVKGLKRNQALELFCRKAFGQNNCFHDHLELSKEVLHFADGNPLALEVLGSSFRQKSKQQWVDKLHNLKLISEPSIYKVLKVSYDELNSAEKETFLDIACFFKGEDIDFVTRIQDDPTSIRYRLNILVDKSLITILNGYRLQMHDLLQEMGQTIVRQESVKEPGERSRLWDHNEIYHVLRKNKGTDKIEGIFLDLSKINDIHLSFQVFAKMSNLRLLKFYMPKHNSVPIMSSKVHLDHSLEYLPEELRYLHWHEYPLKRLPSDFEPENLIELNLPYSKVEQIWEGKKKAFKLKSIDLHHSQYLIRIPDLSEAPNLERVNFRGCTNLAYVPSRVQIFNHLSRLCFRGCESLLSFPSNLHFVCPATINFSFCVNLTKLPQISGNVKELFLSGTAIKEVPSSVGCLTNLKKLNLGRCKRLKRISTSICKLKSLQELWLTRCPDLENFPEILRKVEHLNYNALGRTDIRELPSTFEKGEGIESQLPSSVADSNERKGSSLYLRNYASNGCLSSLKSLYLSGNDFESLPASIKQLSRLIILDLSRCNMLQSIPELPLSLIWLDASNCERLQSLPEIPSFLEELDAPVLERISKHFPDINDNSIRGLPHGYENDGYENCVSIHFYFANSLKLNEKTNNKNLADSQLRIRHMAIASLRLLYESGVESCVLGSTIILPGSEIPEWFSKSPGSKTTLQLPHRCRQNLIGFALSAVLVTPDKGMFGIMGEYNFEIITLNGKKHVRRRWFGGSSLTYSSYSDHVMLGFSPVGNVGFPDDNHHTTVSFKFSSLSAKVKCCGVCPVYLNPNETKPNTFNLNFATKVWNLDDMASARGTSDEEESN